MENIFTTDDFNGRVSSYHALKYFGCARLVHKSRMDHTKLNEIIKVASAKSTPKSPISVINPGRELQSLQESI